MFFSQRSGVTNALYDELTALYRDLLRQGYTREEAARQVDWKLAERIARRRRTREGRLGPPTHEEIMVVFASM